MPPDAPALHQLVVRRTARYLTLGRPSPATRELWYVCHGYGQLAAEFIQNFHAIDDGTRVIVAPEALNRFYKNPEPLRHKQDGVGATWMTSEGRELEIEDYVAYLDLLHAHVLGGAVAAGAGGGVGAAALLVRVLGFSQGAATASRWVALGKVEPQELVLWGGLLPPDLPEAGRRRIAGVPLTVVYGTRDRYATSKLLEDERERMERMGLHPRRLTFDGGHRLDDRTLSAVAAGASEG